MQAIQSVSTLFLLLYRTLTRDADVHFSPQGGAVPAGNALLEAFIQGSDSNTVISGFTGSTPIQSLQSALAQIHLSPVTIPGIKQNLIRSASLTFPTNIVNTGVAATSFTLANPFTASINLIQLSATATFHNLTLGSIPDTDESSHPIVASGHGSVTSSSLPLDFNLDPPTIIQLLLIMSQSNNVDLGPLTELFQFVLSNPSFKPPVSFYHLSIVVICLFHFYQGYKYCRFFASNLREVSTRTLIWCQYLKQFKAENNLTLTVPSWTLWLI